jgi:hypothetical protein
MPEYDEDGNEIEETEDEESEKESSVIRKMRAENKDAKAKLKELEPKAAEGEAAKRELALLKAGIDTESPLGKLFAKAYDGELDVETVKAAAIEAGVLKTEETEETSEVSDEEKAAVAKAQEVTSGAETQVSTDEPDAPMTAFREVMDRDGTREEAMATAFRTKLDKTFGPKT